MCILVPGVPQVSNAQTRKTWFIRLGHHLPLFCGPVLIHCWCFRWWTGVGMSTLTGLQLCSHKHNKLWLSLYSDTFLSQQASTFLAVWATAARLLAQTTRAGLCCPCASVTTTLLLVHHRSILGPLLIETDHCRPATSHNSGRFGDALIQWQCPKLYAWSMYSSSISYLYTINVSI